MIGGHKIIAGNPGMVLVFDSYCLSDVLIPHAHCLEGEIDIVGNLPILQAMEGAGVEYQLVDWITMVERLYDTRA